MNIKAHKGSYKSGGTPSVPRGVKRLALIATALLLISGVAMAKPSASTGQSISSQCAACHGSDGVAINSQYPNLAGQNYQYLVQQMQSFKSGQRNNAIMHAMTSGLSKVQIQDLAAYFSSIKNAACNDKH